MSLPYTEETTFTFKGKVHSTEKAVITAAVTDAVGNPGLAATVLAASCQLAPLLARACELGLDGAKPAEKPAPT